MITSNVGASRNEPVSLDRFPKTAGSSVSTPLCVMFPENLIELVAGEPVGLFCTTILPWMVAPPLNVTLFGVSMNTTPRITVLALNFGFELALMRMFVKLVPAGFDVVMTCGPAGAVADGTYASNADVSIAGNSGGVTPE